jgi:SAM-dependent methyltransferase/uncharacterized protein YbaR (Trm112 family)
LRRDVVGLLVCPRCDGELKLHGERSVGDQIQDGRLTCSDCGMSYAIGRGIPRLADVRDTQDADVEDTVRSFGHEFTRLDPVDPPDVTERQQVVRFFRTTGLDKELYRHLPNRGKYRDLTPEDISYEPNGDILRGKLVLDAGSGGGRYSKIAASYGARVVAMDMSDAIERTAAVAGPTGIVDAVQGDVLRPPLRSGSFDLVFSIGVLHHTADTRRGVAALARLVRPGGILAIWVYGPDYWGGAVRGTITRAVRRVLLHLPLAARDAFCRSVLFPIGRLQMRLARRWWTKALFAPVFALNVPRYPDPEIMLTTIFDYWSPPLIRTHTSEEMYDWFAENGLVDIQILPLPVAVRGMRPPS